MSDQTKVDIMGTSQTVKQEHVKRKAHLSPELTEVLHMLKSLESEFSAKEAEAR